MLENLYMSKQSLTDLAQRGFLGSHSHHHYPLGLLPLQTIKSEINSSKTILEELTNSKIELIAYPFGTREACTEDVAEIAKKEFESSSKHDASGKSFKDWFENLK